MKNNGKIKIKIDLIEKLGADSIIYGTDENGHNLCYRENGNTKLNINESVQLEVEKDKFHGETLHIATWKKNYTNLI